jgi:ADP-ribosylglycohydrolase
MALCLAESLIECDGRLDARDQMQRYIRWRDEGHLSSNGRCFDIGVTVGDALRRYERTGDPIAGSTDPLSSGNGSIMRLAPVAIRFAGRPREGIEACAESSRTTHASTIAVDACRLLGALIVGALGGATKEEILAPRYAPVPDYWDDAPLSPEIDEIASGSFTRREPPTIKGSGYAARSLEAALWALHRGRDFREGVLLAVNLGDDADTTAAVFGQIAGALYGEEGIPGEWLARLTLRDLIESFADRLFGLARQRATG